MKWFSLLSLWLKSYGVTIQMKPLQQYFHIVLCISYVALTFESARTKSYGVTVIIQMKATKRFFLLVMFICSPRWL